MFRLIDPDRHPVLYATLQGLGLGIMFCLLFYLTICAAIESFFPIDNIGTLDDLFRFFCLLIILSSIALANILRK